MKKPAAFGKYFLLERINVGGMAEVFRGKAFGLEGFERLVAVKRILPQVAEDKAFIRTFIEEAKLSVQLTHANIAQIFDLGVVDGSYYLALEHIHGRDLRTVFERCRQLGEVMPIAQACFVAMKICEGLEYAHTKRDAAGRELALVHRDVSPPNVLVSFEGEVKLIDFGVAKAAGAGARATAGVLRGKLGYLSPEQLHGDPIDRRGDVYSCGVVLYELLTGERLFPGDTAAAQDRARGPEILAPSTYNRKIPDELERIVLKALAGELADRYQTARDLHDELQAFVYTAGEFYSRKDLAGWMKKTFGKEIEEEAAKLEGFRQLKPPPGMIPTAAAAVAPSAAATPVAGDAAGATGVSPAVRAATGGKAPPRRSTQPVAMLRHTPPPTLVTRPQAVTAAPPVPPSRSSSPTIAPAQPAPSAAPAPPTLTAPPAVPPPLPPALPPEVVEPPAPPARPDPTEPLPLQSSGDTPPVVKLDPSAIGWEDDDVETQIYADQDAGAKPKPPPRPGMSSHRLPLQPPAASSPAVSLASASLVVGEPVHAAPLRSAAPPVPPPASGWERPAPTEFPGGSNELTPSQAPPPRFDLHDSSAAPLPAQREISAPSRLVSAVHPVTPPGLDPLASFGARIAGGRRSPGARRVPRTIALGGAVAVVVVAVLWILRGEPSPAPPLAPKLIVADASTGFDLYVVPTGILSWKLDGESRTERLPSRIRGIAAGAHTIEIEPPPGFVRQVQRVDVEQGKAPKVEIKLPPDKASDKVPDKVNDKPASPGPAAASPGATRPLGVLVLGSKPPCEIYVDGNSSGLRTPQQDLTLPIGRHRITLVNAEFKIRESFPVDITAGAPVKLVKDYSDRLPR